MKKINYVIILAVVITICIYFAWRAFSREEEDIAIDIIREYVLKSRQWEFDECIIKPWDEYDGYVVYCVYNSKEMSEHLKNHPFVGGGGTSFFVIYDPIKRQIIREEQSQ